MKDRKKPTIAKRLLDKIINKKLDFMDQKLLRKIKNNEIDPVEYKVRILKKLHHLNNYEINLILEILLNYKERSIKGKTIH